LWLLFYAWQRIRNSQAISPDNTVTACTHNANDLLKTKIHDRYNKDHKTGVPPQMLTTHVEPLESTGPLPEIKGGPEKFQGVLALSSFLFVLLQSVCTFFTALDGLRLIIGVGSLTSIIQAGIIWDHFHTDWIRIPMMGFALAGSLLNLAILRRIRRLRNHPAAQWRQKPLSPRKVRMERIQLILSWITLALMAVEEVTHLHTFHKL
jgi:hypothetical protein